MQTGRDSAASSSPTLVRALGFRDTLLFLVGSIIGSSIFLTAGEVAASLPSVPLFLGVWAIGGGVTLLAGFAIAELGAMFPETGGSYVYLRKAYGPMAAFLYGWLCLAVFNSGAAATLAVGFADYVGVVVPALGRERLLLTIRGWSLSAADMVALGGIWVLTAINLLGIRRAAKVMNAVTALKFAAIAALIILGVGAGSGKWSHLTTPSAAAMSPATMLLGLGVALAAVFWAFDGWIYVAWVAGEVQEPQRVIPRALFASIAVAGGVYVLLSVVYLYAFPLSELAAQTTVAEAVAARLFSPAASTWMAGVIALCIFGALAGSIISEARVTYAMAHDGLFFSSLAKVHPRWRVPSRSLVVHGTWASLLALNGSYSELFTYTIFVGVLSYGLTVSTIFVLRRKYPDRPRPYRCFGYPWTPGLYLAACAAWAYGAIRERPVETLVGLGITLLGIPGYFYWRKRIAVTL